MLCSPHFGSDLVRIWAAPPGDNLVGLAESWYRKGRAGPSGLIPKRGGATTHLLNTFITMKPNCIKRETESRPTTAARSHAPLAQARHPGVRTMAAAVTATTQRLSTRHAVCALPQGTCVPFPSSGPAPDRVVVGTPPTAAVDVMEREGRKGATGGGVPLVADRMPRVHNGEVCSGYAHVVSKAGWEGKRAAHCLSFTHTAPRPSRISA